MQKNLGMSESQISGNLDQSTEDALDDFLKTKGDRLHPAHAESILESRNRKRKATAFAQLTAHENEIDAGKVDGFLGPQTDFAIVSLLFLVEHGRPPHNWKDHHSTIPNPNGWPVDDRAALEAFYGAPTETGDNLVRIQAPFKHALSWNPSTKISSFFCHPRVRDSLMRVLTNVHEHYGDAELKKLGLDQWGGCFNFRKKRGGNTLSTHSWGISLDYHPERNQLRWGFERAFFAHPAYDAWWSFWEEEGWVSLGRTQNFDWMHIQAARLRD